VSAEKNDEEDADCSIDASLEIGFGIQESGVGARANSRFHFVNVPSALRIHAGRGGIFPPGLNIEYRIRNVELRIKSPLPPFKKGGSKAICDCQRSLNRR